MFINVFSLFLISQISNMTAVIEVSEDSTAFTQGKKCCNQSHVQTFI